MNFLDGLSKSLEEPVDPSGGFEAPQATKTEVFKASADATFKNDLSISKELFVQKATKARDDLFRSIEGKTIYETTGIRQFTTGQARGNTFEQLVPEDRDTQLDNFIRGIKNQDPEKYAGLQTSEEILQGVRDEANESRARQQDTIRRAPEGIGTTAANFAGAGAASLVDPINVAASVISAPAASGILTFIAVNAVASAGSEALIQGDIELWQRELGNEYGIKEKTTAVAIAGLFGGLLPTAFLGASKAAGAVKGALPTKAKFTKRSKLLADGSEELRARGDIDEANSVRALARDAELDEANIYREIGDSDADFEHDFVLQDIADSLDRDEFPDFSKARDINPQDVLNLKLDDPNLSNGRKAVIQEAQEIAEASKEVALHGTTKQFDAFIPSKHGNIGKGVYFFTDPKNNAVNQFSGPNGRVISADIPEGKFFKYDNSTKAEFGEVLDDLGLDKEAFFQSNGGKKEFFNSEDLEEFLVESGKEITFDKGVEFHLERAGYIGSVGKFGDKPIKTVFNPGDIKVKNRDTAGFDTSLRDGEELLGNRHLEAARNPSINDGDIIKPIDARSSDEVINATVAARNRQFSPEAEAQRELELDDFIKDLDDNSLNETLSFNGREIKAKDVKLEFEAEAKKIDVLKTCSVR